MIGYAVRRLIVAIPTLLIIIALAFFMMRIAPGGPFDQERSLPAQIEQNLRAAYHLDEPVWQQFGRYLGGLLRGDFGPSFKYRDFSVTELIAAGFPVSLQIGAAAILFAVLVGGGLGALAAVHQNRTPDHAAMAVATVGLALPNFVVAPLLTLCLGVYLDLLPVGGWGSPAQAVLPIATLALPQIATIARLARAGLVEVLRADYIRTARAKGLPGWRVLARHALYPAVVPVVSYLGPAIAAVITGSVVVETIFGIPGVGRYFVQGALNRDYTLVMGVVVLYAGLIIALNLVVDLVYGWLDPRVRYD